MVIQLYAYWKTQQIKFYCMKGTIYDGERNHKSGALSPGQE